LTARAPVHDCRKRKSSWKYGYADALSCVPVTPGLFASFTKRLHEHPPILVDSDYVLSPVTSRQDMVA
jgi:hypothetical protein